jgi:hypothetical protein
MLLSARGSLPPRGLYRSKAIVAGAPERPPTRRRTAWEAPKFGQVQPPPPGRRTLAVFVDQ